MEKEKFCLLSIKGKPELKIRYYKNHISLMGIIIFVHGVSHGAWCWENFVDYFTEKGYACFAINLRGHGDDDKNKKGFIKQYVSDVVRCVNYCEEFCKDNNLPYSKPYIIGHSMGGGIVELYISQYSDTVKGAVLFAPATAQGMGKFALKTTFSKTGLYTEPTVLGWKTNKYLSKSNFFVAKTDNKNFIPRITDKKELKYYDEQLCSESIFAMLGLIKFKITDCDNLPIFVIGSNKDAYFPTDSLNITANFYHTKPMILRGLCHDMMLDPDWKDAAWSVLQFVNNPKELKDKPDEFIHNLEEKLYPDDKNVSR